MTIETRAPMLPTPVYRCGMCRQLGHDRRRCPYTATEATRLRVAFNRERVEERRRVQRELNERQRELNELQQQLNRRAPESEWRAEVYSQVADMQRRVEMFTGNGPTRPPTGPTVRERKIQEILFENAEQIPNGLYKELMDALVIRD